MRCSGHLDLRAMGILSISERGWTPTTPLKPFYPSYKTRAKDVNLQVQKLQNTVKFSETSRKKSLWIPFEPV